MHACGVPRGPSVGSGLHRALEGMHARCGGPSVSTRSRLASFPAQNITTSLSTRSETGMYAKLCGSAKYPSSLVGGKNSRGIVWDQPSLTLFSRHKHGGREHPSVWLRSKVRDDVGATTSNTPDEEKSFDDAQPHWWSVDLMDAETIEGVKGAKGNGKEPAPPGILNKEEREGVKNAWEKLIRWSRISLARAGRDEEALRKSTYKVVIFGGGAFGTAIASLLARNKNTLDVVILMRDQENVDSINTKHRNKRYFPDIDLPKNVSATTDATEAIADAQYIVHAIPVQSSRSFLEGVKALIPADVPILCLSKGLEIGTGQMMTEVIDNTLERAHPIVILSGPSFAVELMAGLPTMIVAASNDLNLARDASSLLASPCLRVNISDDVVGVEIAGALKNVLAIAAGMVEGLELGNNAIAALTSQGCAEIRWLAEKMGAKNATLSGPAGVGDIMLTCFVSLSRNRSVGVRLGAGESLAHILGSGKGVAEGVATAGAVISLGKKYNVSLPVLTAVSRILDDQLTPRTAVLELMNMPQVPEV